MLSHYNFKSIAGHGVTSGERWDTVIIVWLTQRQTAMHTHIHSYGQLRVAIWPNLYVLKLIQADHVLKLIQIEINWITKPQWFNSSKTKVVKKNLFAKYLHSLNGWAQAMDCQAIKNKKSS